MFNDFFNNDWFVRANATAPSVNVLENDKEYKYAHFEQSFTLADDIDKEKISADVNNGVLSIILPKLDEAAQAKASRQIEIH